MPGLGLPRDARDPLLQAGLQRLLALVGGVSAALASLREKGLAQLTPLIQFSGAGHLVRRGEREQKREEIAAPNHAPIPRLQPSSS